MEVITDESEHDAVRERVGDLLDEIRATTSSRPKRRFLRDVKGQICEDDRTIARLNGRRPSARSVMVTFDRRRHDHKFSYGRVDLVLEALDALSGGWGVKRPVSQLRVIQWKGSRRDLRGVLRFLARNNRELRFRRLLVMNYADPPVGHRLR